MFVANVVYSQLGMITKIPLGSTLALKARSPGRFALIANSVCHLCEQLVKIMEIVDCGWYIWLSGHDMPWQHAIRGPRAAPHGPSVHASHASPARPPSRTTIDVASLVINITLNTSRRQAKTPIWDRSDAANHALSREAQAPPSSPPPPSVVLPPIFVITENDPSRQVHYLGK